MRILFVTQWFPPEPGTFVAADIARGLAAEGHTVEVVTGFPNYPTGKIMPGYRVLPYQREEFSERITIHRSPLYPNHDPSIIRRSLNYASFALSAAGIALARVPRCDVALVYSSPATAAFPAMIQRLLGVPYALLIQDVWPDSVLDASFVKGPAARIAERALTTFCSVAYRASSGIGVISPGMAGLLKSRGVPADKIHYTPNWLSDDHLSPEAPATPEARTALGMPAGRTFLYAGNFGDLQNLPPLLEAFSRVPEAQLVLIGNGVMRPVLEAQVESQGLRNVTILPPKDASEIGQYLAAADIQIVSLRDTPLMRVTMPSKVQTALACSRPVLVCAAGDPAELVETNGAGISVTPGDPAATATAIRSFMSMSTEELGRMGDRARALYEQSFSPVAGPKRLEQVLRAATNSRTTGRITTA